MPQPPNLLFVFADQMRGMDMACAGNPGVLTPSLDRLAAEGTHFSRAYANCPVCTPSRGTILTGRYPLSHRAVANDLPLPEDERTIAEVLRQAGYRTGYVGKWHLDGVPRDRFTPPGPRRQGFDFWAAWNCSHAYFDAKVFRDSPQPVPLAGYEPVGHTDLALEFLGRDDPRPFCLFVSWGPPHAPYHQVPQRYKGLYRPERLTIRPNVRDEPPDGLRPPSQDFDPRVLADYYAHITALDEQLGRLLAATDELGLTENTLVVFASDHGDMLWSQGSVKKEQPWEESVRIPLLVRWPGRVPAGHCSQALASTVDLAPTLLGLMGVEPLSSMEGADLSETVLGRQGPRQEAVLLVEPVILDQGFAQGVREWRGLRTPRYTYARWVDGEPWLLYDNEADPLQGRNLVGSSDHAALLQRLDRQLDQRLAAIGDRCEPWDETIRSLGLEAAWNRRERTMHPESPRLVGCEATATERRRR